MNPATRLTPSMWLFTAEQRRALIEQWRKAQAEDEGGEPFPIVKLFLPGTDCVWLLTELNPDQQICFGLCDLGMGCPELGYVSLIEIVEAATLPGLTVERDTSFRATKTLSAYAREANHEGAIKA